MYVIVCAYQKVYPKYFKFAGGFTKDWAPGKLTSCEDDFFRLVCHLEERFSYNEVKLQQTNKRFAPYRFTSFSFAFFSVLFHVSFNFKTILFIVKITLKYRYQASSTVQQQREKEKLSLPWKVGSKTASSARYKE